jgi:hypothetical protein
MTNDKNPSVFLLMLLIRDARSTKGAQRELLYALALRCSPDKEYSCWPSYEKLAQDTCLSKPCLKRAAASLEAAKLIKRVVRQNHSNLFYLNVALIQEQAEHQRDADKAAREAAQFDPTSEHLRCQASSDKSPDDIFGNRSQL